MYGLTIESPKSVKEKKTEEIVVKEDTEPDEETNKEEPKRTYKEIHTHTRSQNRNC